MRSTFSLLPYINRSKVKADGTTAVLCRITIDGKQTVISTSIYCRPEDWNGKKNEIKSTRENNRLQEYLRIISEAYEEILKSQGVVSAEMLKSHITQNNIHPTTLLQMGEWERERLKKHSEEIDSTSSYRSSMYYQKYLTDYIVSSGKKDICFEEVTEDFGKSYKAYLKKCKNFGASQTNHCLRWLTRLLYLAVDKEIIRVNPCEELEYETKPEAKHRYISRDEFKKILSTPMYDNRLETGFHILLPDRIGVCGYTVVASPPHRDECGGQTVYPYQPQEDKGGSVHTPASHSGTDIVAVQHGQ